MRSQRTLLALADAARGVQPAAIEVPLALVDMHSDSTRRQHAQLVAEHILQLRSPQPDSAEAALMAALADADDGCSTGDWEEQYERWAARRIAAAHAAAKTLAARKPLLDAFQCLWRSVSARRSGPGPGLVDHLFRAETGSDGKTTTPQQRGSGCRLLALLPLACNFYFLAANQVCDVWLIAADANVCWPAPCTAVKRSSCSYAHVFAPALNAPSQRRTGC